MDDKLKEKYIQKESKKEFRKIFNDLKSSNKLLFEKRVNELNAELKKAIFFNKEYKE